MVSPLGWPCTKTPLSNAMQPLPITRQQGRVAGLQSNVRYYQQLFQKLRAPILFGMESQKLLWKLSFKLQECTFWCNRFLLLHPYQNQQITEMVVSMVAKKVVWYSLLS
uniref:Uncharacterized protein n=1 Tax=Photinus pyralis TaxID=7054 RepID=A0A1Y1MMY5_PHOPY